MNKYQWVKKNLTMIKVGIRNGSFSCNILRDFEVYEDFKNSPTKKGKMQIYSELSEKYRVSEKSIQMIISKMNSSA